MHWMRRRRGEGEPVLPTHHTPRADNDAAEESVLDTGEQSVDGEIRAEMQALLSRAQNVLPFVALLASRLLYEHCVPLGVFVGATAALLQLDARFRKAIAPREYARLREESARPFGGRRRGALGAIAPVSLMCAALVDAVLIDSGDAAGGIVSRLRLTARLSLVEVLWIVCVSDLQLRFVALAAKAALAALAAPLEQRAEQGAQPDQADAAAAEIFFVAAPDSEASPLSAMEDGTVTDPEEAKQMALPLSEHARARRRAALVEMCSTLVRTVLPAPVWLGYYAAESYGHVFVGAYVSLKVAVAVRQSRTLLQALKAHATGELEYGTFATPAAQEAQGHPDCPICCDPPSRAVALPCGHIYCDACIFEWLEKERTCPCCRAEVPYTSAVPPQFRDGAAPAMPQLL